jgi:hypothetical protein
MKKLIFIASALILFGAGCAAQPSAKTPAAPVNKPAATNNQQTIPANDQQSAAPQAVSPSWQWSVASETASAETITAQSPATPARGFTFSYPKATVAFQAQNESPAGLPGLVVSLTSPLNSTMPNNTTLTIAADQSLCGLKTADQFGWHSAEAGTRSIGGEKFDYAVSAYDNAGGADAAGEAYQGKINGVCYLMTILSNRSVPQDAYNKNIDAMRQILQTIKFF